MRVKDQILVGSTIHTNKYPIAPSHTVAGNAALTRSTLVPHSLAEEWQSQGVLGPADPVIRALAIAPNGADEPHESRMLNKPCDERVRHGHMSLQEPVKS
jgi:hypothetical protein